MIGATSKQFFYFYLNHRNYIAESWTQNSINRRVPFAVFDNRMEGLTSPSERVQQKESGSKDISEKSKDTELAS